MNDLYEAIRALPVDDPCQRIHNLNPYDPWNSGCDCKSCSRQVANLLAKASRDRDRYQSRLIQAELELIELRRKAALTDLLLSAINGMITMSQLAQLPEYLRHKIWRAMFQ